MSTTSKWILVITGSLLAAAGFVGLGVNVGQTLASQTVVPGANREAAQDTSPAYGYGPGMMRGIQTWGQLGNSPLPDQQTQSTDEDDDQPNPVTYPDDYGPGMMDGGMMGGYGTGLSDVDPLSTEDAQRAIESYLTVFGDADLELREVMIFDNHAYGLIAEESTGIGALEVLVDPVTVTVYPEHGPNMMWNLKYSPMGYGMMGSGMMRGWRNVPDASAEMPVTEEAAIEAAQQYLDAYLPGTQVEHHADAFYGYYTLHVLRDGEIAGMLRVNGYTGQVFLHTWHGDFIEMTED